MDFIGFDLGTVSSQVCILTEDGELIERRIAITSTNCSAAARQRASSSRHPQRASGSRATSKCLGHEVVIADTNFAPMYATRSRKVKTDKRDARTLAEACRLGAYHPVHRTSDRQRHVRAQLAVREAMVRTRSRYIRSSPPCSGAKGCGSLPGTPRASLSG